MTATTHPFNTAGLEPNDVRFAWASLQAVCSVLCIDPIAAVSKRRKDAAIFARKLWFYAARTIIPGTLLARISGYSRDTVEDDAEEVAQWRRRNAYIDQRCDEIADMMEPVRSLVTDAADLLEECRLERLAIRTKAPRTLAELAAPPPAPPDPLVSVLLRSKPLIRQLGPVLPGRERPEGAIAWAYADDTVSGKVICIGWAGARDILEDAKGIVEEAMRTAGKRLYMRPEVLSHPTLRNKYQMVVRIGDVVVRPAAGQPSV